MRLVVKPGLKGVKPATAMYNTFLLSSVVGALRPLVLVAFSGLSVFAANGVITVRVTDF